MAEPDATETRRVATEYAAARVRGDYARMYSLLSPEDRARIAQGQFEKEERRYRAGGRLRGEPEVAEPNLWNDDVITVTTRVRYTPAHGHYKGHEGTTTEGIRLVCRGGRWYPCLPGASAPGPLPVDPVLALLRLWTGLGYAERSDGFLADHLELLPAPMRSPGNRPADDLDTWLAEQSLVLKEYGVPAGDAAVDCIGKAGSTATIRACVPLTPTRWDPANEPPPKYHEAVYSFLVTARGDADARREWRMTRAEYICVRPLRDVSWGRLSDRILRYQHREAIALLTRFLRRWQAGDAAQSLALTDGAFRPMLQQWVQGGTSPATWGPPQVVAWIGLATPDLILRVRCDLALATGRQPVSRTPCTIDLAWARDEWHVRAVHR